MDRRQFLRSTISAAVVAALPVLAVAETASAPYKLVDLPGIKFNFASQIGRYYNMRFITGGRPGKVVRFANPPALRQGDLLDVGYTAYADTVDYDTLIEDALRALPDHVV